PSGGGSRSSRAGWSTPKLTASGTGSRFPGCGCRRIAVPSTAIAASPRSRCLGPKAMPAAAPSEVDRRLPPLAWACAAFAGGVLLNVDRVPPWASAVALFLIAWRLTSELAGMTLPGTVARLQRARCHRVRGPGRAGGAAARGRGAAHRYAARRAAVPVLPAPAGRVLGDPAWRRGDDRALRHHESGQHREAGGGLRARLPRAVRLRRPGARGALLARPGTARLRWPHVAAELRRLPPARASAICREALP